MISAENIHKNYGQQQVLKGINLGLELGKIYGIVGKNGTGKSTFFNCLAQLDTFEGKIESSIENLRTKTGYLQAESVFLTKITGREYLQLLCNARKLPFQNFDEKNIFKLPLNQYASTYSTGMKKKLALLGILVQKNDFFLLDEPFNGIDAEGYVLIQEIVKHLKEQQKTVLLSSHILESLKQSCDVIFMLQNGIISATFERQNFDKINYDEVGEDFRKQLGRLF